MIISEIRSKRAHSSCYSSKFKAPADFSHHAILAKWISLRKHPAEARWATYQSQASGTKPSMKVLGHIRHWNQIESNVFAPVLLNVLNSLQKEIKCSTSLAFDLFSPTELINSIKHEHLCKILCLSQDINSGRDITLCITIYKPLVVYVFSYIMAVIDSRKRSSGVCQQHRRRPACASAQSDQHLCYSLFRKYHI